MSWGEKATQAYMRYDISHILVWNLQAFEYMLTREIQNTKDKLVFPQQNTYNKYFIHLITIS